MDSPKFRNCPRSSWLLVYCNTIEKPGNSSVQPTGLQERVWGRGSSVTSCVVQLLVRSARPAAGLGCHRGSFIKVFEAHGDNSGWVKTLRPALFIREQWKASGTIFLPCLGRNHALPFSWGIWSMSCGFWPQVELSIRPGTAGQKSIPGHG